MRLNKLRKDFMGMNHILCESKYTAVYKAELKNLLGKVKSDEIINTASRVFDTLIQKYPNLLKEEMAHAYTNIFPVIAFYKVLREYRIDSAITILENGATKIANKKGNIYSAVVRLPGMKGIFLNMLSMGIEKSFGDTAGFCHEVLVKNKRTIEFNITKCPYQFYCDKEGCPELVYIFCKNDEYVYGNLSGIAFIRTKTLGMGGNLCDFKFKR